ncbi:MAG: UDP-N-acetylmuramoyl-tripeptide--D-alanyl-D-alanine ligase [Thermomicrobiales bacterium]
MSNFRLADVLTGTGGTLRGELPPDTIFPALERNSRNVGRHDLFIAIKGEKFDGHDYVTDALAAGARAAIVSRSWADAHPDVHPLIVVDAPIDALQRWAEWKRDQNGPLVIGITGSIGKTSAKESISAVLSQRFTVYRSPGNFNSELGLPLAILDAPDNVQIMVLEMGGAYAFGELALLARIAKPHIGVVTNVYPVHLERMGSLEAIAETKAELVDSIPETGVVILNEDDFRVRAMASRTSARVITYGLDDNADIHADAVTTDGWKGTSFAVTIEGERNFVKVPFIGSHGVYIALVAIAVGYSFDMHLSEMVQGLQDPSIQVRLLFVPGPRGAQLIDDTYNASSPSVLSALGVLKEVPAKRRIGVLGEMRELGQLAEEEHRLVGQRAADIVDVLVTYGSYARVLADEAAKTARDAGKVLPIESFDEEEHDALVAYLHEVLQEGDVVLLKGSRGLEMERIVTAIRSDASATSASTTGADTGSAEA